MSGNLRKRFFRRNVRNMSRNGKQGTIEVLAPVGGSEQLKAAVYCGADAVYFGLKQFNARRNADNFFDEDLSGTVRFCHAHGVAVHITLNTLILDRELAEMRDAADTACGSGADAVITQDLAVAEYIRTFWPSVQVHASTQMAVHNAEGAHVLSDAGYHRIVLARELTLPEIASVAEKTEADCEVFIHGAHCMSVSGNCYMSAMIGGRSGNRGLCAQPCRLAWEKDGREYVLSLKDMSYIGRIRDLEKTGVRSVKIEGRMKRAEYVAAAVTACREAIEGRAPDMDSLRAVFSRSGFTDGFLTGKRTLDMFGIRTKEDVTAAKDVLAGLAQLYRKDPQRIAVDMHFTAEAGKRSVLTVTDGTNTSVSEGDVPEEARTQPLTAESASRNLFKTGGTPYTVRGFEAEIGPDISIPPGQMNAMRRDALEKLTDLRCGTLPQKQPYAPAEHAPYVPGKKVFRLRFERAGQVFDGGEDTQTVLPLRLLEEHPEFLGRFGERLIAELPALIWEGDGPAIRERLLKLRENGLRHVLSGNICAPELVRGTGLILHGGAELNVLNTEALERYARYGFSDLTLSFELPHRDMGAIRSDVRRGFIGYGHLPLMKFRNCPGKGRNGCGDCTGNTVLTDRMREKYPLLCRERKFSELLNCVPVYTADRRMPDTDFETLYFTVEPEEQCRHVYALYRNGAAPDFRRTGGLYFRELL